jgi:hypothetical protein
MNIALALGVVWSLTLLVTRDKITASPRKRLHAWLRKVAHHEVRPIVDLSWGNPECSCGWAPDPDDPDSDDLQRHIHLARISKPGWWMDLVKCPWCVSFWLAVPVAVGAHAIDWVTGWQAIAFPFVARVIAGAGTAAFYPEDD